ncbi:MAG: tetraacyldisaccharide 4'-kinase [Bacteroidota bacterium]
MSTYLRLLLIPFSLIYGLIILVRNKLFDWNLLHSTRFNLPVICVGNLVVGGSGKTPVTEYLVALLKNKRIAILSRGYGRETKGFILADRTATARLIGDEPMQYFNKFPDVAIAVCEDRVHGLRMLEKDYDVIILDDAFQHRSLQPGFSVLLFDYKTFFKPQLLLPAGNLREPFSGYQRANVILITKCPSDEPQKEAFKITSKFQGLSREKIFFSSIAYFEPVSLFDHTKTAPLNKTISIHLITGIANTTTLLEYLNSISTLTSHLEYPDHYQFSLNDISKLVSGYKKDLSTHKIILTTEKDSQRLLDAPIKELLLDLPVFYLPIHYELRSPDKNLFDQMILDYVSSATRNR